MDQRARENLKREETFCQLALAHMRIHEIGGKDQPLAPTIHPQDTPKEWSAWERYFLHHLGFEPYVMKRVRQGMGKEMTVPAQWPEQFDGSYQREAA